MSCSEMSSTDTTSEDEVDSCNFSRDGIIYGRSDYSGWGGESMISDPNIASSSTSTYNLQQQQVISTAAENGTDHDSMISVSSSDASSSWFSLNNNTNKQSDHQQEILRVKKIMILQEQEFRKQVLQLHQQVHRLQLRRRELLTPRPGTSMNNNTNMDKGRPLVEINLENPDAFPMTVIQPNMQQFQDLQPQIAAISSPNTILFRPTTASLIPPVYSLDMGIARGLVKEYFRELMGGDA